VGRYVSSRTNGEAQGVNRVGTTGSAGAQPRGPALPGGNLIRGRGKCVAIGARVGSCRDLMRPAARTQGESRPGAVHPSAGARCMISKWSMRRSRLPQYGQSRWLRVGRCPKGGSYRSRSASTSTSVRTHTGEGQRSPALGRRGSAGCATGDRAERAWGQRLARPQRSIRPMHATASSSSRRASPRRRGDRALRRFACAYVRAVRDVQTKE
jgi:hypothetical protein